ncbi:hypothetical protein AVEN_208890-1 [Araneus ventricosus]|uniref:Uncharacterized protein n=1 Tax=Araneus ventricosus TaxID=182803 RepID=A0A4Y2EZQ9_ARAVE|nr:hypothetical protein AVEN_208890-1 [Araneus ventricosus]
MYLSGSRCNSSSDEAGVLEAVTGHCPTPPEGGAHYHRQWASTRHYRTHQRSETSLRTPWLHGNTFLFLVRQRMGYASTTPLRLISD